MNTMNFNYSFSKVSLLAIVLLSGFSKASATTVTEVVNSPTIRDQILLSSQNLEIAQNETVPIANLETAIIEQINRARENPHAYADWLEAQKQYYDGIMLRLPGEKPIRTNKGLQALEEAIDFVRQQSPLTPLTYSEAIAIAAQEQLTPITENSQDTRAQNISYGKVTAEGIVFQLVVDDGFRDRRHRLAIFSPSNSEAGVFCQADQVYEQICAIAYKENPETPVVQEDEPSNPVAETPEEITIEPENAPREADLGEISLERPESIPQETIDPLETPSVEENVIEPKIEEENDNTSALNLPSPNSFVIDKVERGFLEEGDKVIPNDGSLYDSYPLVVKAGESFVISLESADFDTFLAIMDEEGNIIEQNDDLGEDDSNSQLRVTISRDGNYSLIVNAYDQGGQGAYILTISRNNPSSLEDAEQ
ncbi:MAG: hypothetical protein AB4372_13955 [Xenococcus sp. (in: cyanobacteria)]